MIVRFGHFALDSAQRLLTRDGALVHLTPKAFDLLTLLVEEAPRVVRKDELHKRLWPGTFVADATLVALVKDVRRAIANAGSTAPAIRTAHGVGYAFAAPLERAAGAHAGLSRWIVVGARRVPLAEGENLIGRDPAFAVFLDTPGVSRRHARIMIDGPGAVLEDLGSKNGTALGGAPLSRPTILRDGDEILVGPVPIIFRASRLGISTDTRTRGVPRPRR